MQKSFVRGTWQAKRAFSPAVITQGAQRTIFIAGHTGQADDSGRSLGFAQPDMMIEVQGIAVTG